MRVLNRIKCLFPRRWRLHLEDGSCRDVTGVFSSLSWDIDRQYRYDGDIITMYSVRLGLHELDATCYYDLEHMSSRQLREFRRSLGLKDG